MPARVAAVWLAAPHKSRDTPAMRPQESTIKCISSAQHSIFFFLPFKVLMKNSMRLLKPAVLLMCITLLSGSFLSGCTTSTYGQAPTRDEKVADQFRFKIYVGALSGAETADKDAKVEIEKYLAKQNYKAYTIADRRYNLLPEYYEYTVKFTR